MDETMKLIEMAHSGDKAARERLVMDNVGLVWSIVRRFTGRGCETEDLFQIGSIGLIKAIDKFDTSYDVRFSTYAVPMITGEIKRFLRDDGMIKVSRSIKELGFKVSAVRESLSGSLGREPTLEEISEALEVSKEEVAASLEAGCQVESLYAPSGSGEDNTLSLIDKVAALRIPPSAQVMFICQADCEVEARAVAEELKARYGVKEVYINYIGPVIGSHTGPNTMGLFFVGTQR